MAQIKIDSYLLFSAINAIKKEKEEIYRVCCYQLFINLWCNEELGKKIICNILKNLESCSFLHVNEMVSFLQVTNDPRLPIDKKEKGKKDRKCEFINFDS